MNNKPDSIYYAERLAAEFYNPKRQPDTALIEDACLALDRLLDGKATTERNDYLEDTTLASFILEVMSQRVKSAELGLV